MVLCIVKKFKENNIVTDYRYYVEFANGIQINFKEFYIGNIET